MLTDPIQWQEAKTVLEDFGGSPIKLTIMKTGLPFFDTLRLYGAIDLYIGLRETVSITDRGEKWEVTGYSRNHMTKGRAEAAFRQVWGKKKPKAEDFCANLKKYITDNKAIMERLFLPVNKELAGIDSALQSGIRDVAAAKYDTLQTGQTSQSTCCVSRISLQESILAFAGKKRIEDFGSIIFLPIFEGLVDFTKIISPLRMKTFIPNFICSQALLLLALKSSLFTEGYEKNLSAVVYNTSLSGQRSDNYSGVITLKSTAIGKIEAANFIGHAYQIFQMLVNKAWIRQGREVQPAKLAMDALAMAYWLMQPSEKNLIAFITSQERLKEEGMASVFIKTEYVREVFKMSYIDWTHEQHETIKKFAKATASGIYWARMRRRDTYPEQMKAWYDEVTLLRSSANLKQFINSVMTLIEQGHRERHEVGMAEWGEEYNPEVLCNLMGQNKSKFEEFKNLFRMYLIQQSKYIDFNQNVVEKPSEAESTNKGESE